MASTSATTTTTPETLSSPLRHKVFGYRRDHEHFFPVVMHADRVDQDCIHYLQTRVPAFHISAPDGLELVGYRRCVDHPRKPEHTYYEAYFHGLASTGKSVPAINPRRGGREAKVAAHPALRAYMEVFRRENRSIFDEIARKLRTEVKGSKDTQTVSTLFATLIEQGRHFADLAVQLHCNDGIHGEHIGMHSDAANSLLHFATSIQGHRILHADLYPAQSIISPADFSKPPAAQQMTYAQHECDTYLSSPFAFRHGVEYPECSFENRIIAVQSRFLLGEEELTNLFLPECDFRPIMQIVSDVMLEREKELRMPKLEQVQELEREFAAQPVDGEENSSETGKRCVIS